MDKFELKNLQIYECSKDPYFDDDELLGDVLNSAFHSVNKITTKTNEP